MFNDLYRLQLQFELFYTYINIKYINYHRLAFAFPKKSDSAVSNISTCLSPERTDY